MSINLSAALLTLAVQPGQPTPEEREKLLTAARSLSHRAGNAGGVRSIVEHAVSNIRKLISRLDASDEDVAPLVKFCDELVPLKRAEPARPAEVPAPAAPTEPPAPAFDIAAAEATIERLRAEVAEAEGATATLDERLAVDEGALDEAERAALPTSDASPEWKAHANLSARVARARARSKHAHAQLDRLRGEADAAERAHLEARFADAERRAGLGAIDAMLAPAVEIRVATALRVQDDDRQVLAIVYPTIQSHLAALEEFYAIGEKLGLHRGQLEMRLRAVDGMSVLRRVAALAGAEFESRASAASGSAQ